jgi:hypothetical protein
MKLQVLQASCEVYSIEWGFLGPEIHPGAEKADEFANYFSHYPVEDPGPESPQSTA